MKEPSEHRRFNDETVFHHEREDYEIPLWLKWTFIAINRVGFPVVAFFFMWYLTSVSLKNMTQAIDKQSLSLETLVLTVNANHEDGKQWRVQMLQDIRDLRNTIK
jgi:hypothetical protein